MNQTSERLTIGEFSRLTRLSLKALRLYDELGLLPPAEVDAASGYRFYRADQAARAERIALLRRLELPLADIQTVLGLPPDKAAMRVRAHSARRERIHREQRELLPYVEHLLKGEDMPEFGVQERSVPTQPVAAIQRRVVVPHVQGFIDEACRTLRATIEGQGRVASPEFAVLYHGQVDFENDGPVEVIMGFTGGPLAPSGEVYVREEAAHRELYTTISLRQLEFPAILGAYDAVSAQVQSRGLTCPMSPREVYFNDRMDVQPDEPFCHVAFPVAEPGHA